ncbi:response regulator [Xanthobacter sediminis]
MKPLLLLVEDDPVEARRLESAVRLMGYEPILAGNGDAALALMGRLSFDVVLLDLVLPELDGMGLLGAMTARGLNVPVVAAVTAGNIDAAASAIRAGARDFVVKPAGALRLEVALANAIALGGRSVAAAPRDAGRTLRAVPPDIADTPAIAAPSLVPPAVPIAWTARPSAPAPWVDPGGHVRPLEEIEEKVIRFACALYGGRLTEVARRLGIGRSTLYRKLSRLGLAVPDGQELPRHPEPIAAHVVAAE